MKEKTGESLSVCLFSHTSEISGGAEKSLLELTTELIRDHGVICSVILPNEGPLKDKLEEVGASTLVSEFYWWSNIPPEGEIKPRFINSFKSVLEELLPKLEKINPDVILTNTIVNPWGAVTASFLNKPHVWFVREFGKLGYGLEFYLQFKEILNIIKDSSNLILTNSDAVKRELFGKSLCENILTVYNYIAIPSEFYSKSDGDYFKRAHAIKLLIIGKISEIKGQEDAILAVNELITMKKDIELVIIGGSLLDDYLGKLNKIVEDKNLGGCIKFYDHIDNIYPVINQADIILVCSRYEAFGRVTLESMLLKKPVIGTNSGGTPELVKEGFNGLLYEPGDYHRLADKIKYLIENREKIKEFGENGYQFAKENFTKENFGGRIYKLLKDIKSKENPSGYTCLQFVNKLMLDCIAQQNLQLNEKDQKLAEKEQKLIKKDQQLIERDDLIAERDRQISVFSNSFSWKITAPLRWIHVKLRAFIRTVRVLSPTVYHINWKNILIRAFREIQKTRSLKSFVLQFYHFYLYQVWITKNTPKKKDLETQRERAGTFLCQPLISIITPVYNTEKEHLVKCIESVILQTYNNWELCLVDGGSEKLYIKDILKEYSTKDQRIKIAFLENNLGIAGNSNEALKLASGDYVAFLDHDDMLSPDALFENVLLMNQNPEIDLIYSDEDKITSDGKMRLDPHFKPEWSPDMLLSYNYICHFSVVRKRLLDEIGGFRIGFDGSQDYDLILRLTQKTDKIVRIAKILYHWRMVKTSVASHPSTKTYTSDAAKKAIENFLNDKGLEADVLDGAFLNSHRVKYKIKSAQKVSIIIPTRDKILFLKTCVESILKNTEYENFEILIVDNDSREQETHDYYSEIINDKRVRIVYYKKPFNYSLINNFSVNEVDLEYLLFLNNDTKIINRDWMNAMLEHAQRKEVGAVGAKLYYEDNTIQHAGIILGIGGVAGHSHKHLSKASLGYKGRINIIQNLSAVTAACMMMRRRVFNEVGGFDERLGVAFNDVDLCLKIREKGYLIVYTPYAELYHYESKSRGYEDTPERKKRFSKEISIIERKWKHVIPKGDPYYNPNLTLDREDFRIKIMNT